MENKQKCYITTPIYYASGNVQLGNSYTTVACDVMARYNRLMKRDTFFLTGMDEHGQKIAEAAAKAGLSPQQHVDKIAEATKKTWEVLGIKYDGFIRTTNEEHVKAVQEVFEKLIKQGDIYLGKYTGNYCVSCEAFFTKTQLGDSNVCPDCGKPISQVQEESYFLNLKKYEKRLLNYINENPEFIIPETRRNEVISFIESGLDDLCVSRSTFKWGIPILSNPKHVVYVWIDALLNYITALGYGTNHDSNYQKFWVNNTNTYQVVGKDILRFHAIYWPVILMALDLPMNARLYVHGWILNRDGKMSKSRGNAVYPEDVVNRYGIDATRYYLTKELPLGNDGLFTYERFIERYNTELVNDLGNLFSRVTAMVTKYFEGIVPNKKTSTEFDEDLVKVASKAIDDTKACFENFELQDAVEATWTLVRRANKYIDETAPWALAKAPDTMDKLMTVLYNLVESLRVITNLVAPYLIDASPKMLKAIGLENEELCIKDLVFGKEYHNVKVSQIDHLYKRLDMEAEIKALKAIEDAKKQQALNNKPEIDIDEFKKVELKVGLILESKKCEGSSKLLVSKVKIGSEIRQIVSGIAEKYQPVDLIGKKVVVVTNLKKAVIRGYESNGMILCVKEGKDNLELITVSSLPDGSLVE